MSGFFSNGNSVKGGMNLGKNSVQQTVVQYLLFDSMLVPRVTDMNKDRVADLKGLCLVEKS